MIIEIRSHGGFGGITAATSRRIDTDAQPEPRAQELCAAFHPKHAITLSEGQMPAEMLDLLDDL